MFSIAGIAGKRVTRGRVQAIFGMDPAGPLFDMNNPGARFAAGDAVYTEMLATNAGLLGFDQPIGAASFYRELQFKFTRIINNLILFDSQLGIITTWMWNW